MLVSLQLFIICNNRGHSHNIFFFFCADRSELLLLRYFCLKNAEIVSKHSSFKSIHFSCTLPQNTIKIGEITQLVAIFSVLKYICIYIHFLNKHYYLDRKRNNTL